MTPPLIPNELEAAILALFRGPLEQFVSGRDALVKQLRAAKLREEAERVKTLRKPSRIAWVLDNIVHEDPASIEQLADAISAAQTDADLRMALETVKAAIRAVAAVGARIAVRAGHPIEPNEIVSAVHTVIGDSSAFAEFRAGRLVELPEAGGLNLLTALPTRAPSTPTTSSLSAPRGNATASPEPRAQPARQNADLVRTVRADLQRAETSLRDVRERSDHAMQSVRHAEQGLDTAERALQHAQADVEARRSDLERARRVAETAAENLRAAEKAVAAARARLTDGDEG